MLINCRASSPEGGAVSAGRDPVWLDRHGFGGLGRHILLTRHLASDGVHWKQRQKIICQFLNQQSNQRPYDEYLPIPPANFVTNLKCSDISVHFCVYVNILTWRSFYNYL